MIGFALRSCFCIPVMLLCKQQVNGGLTLQERTSNENACNKWKQGASALGFILDQCSEMWNRNLDTREAAKCIGLRATTQLPHWETICLKLHQQKADTCCLSLTKLVTCVNGSLVSDKSNFCFKQKFSNCFFLQYNNLSLLSSYLAILESTTKDSEDRGFGERMRLALSASQRAYTIFSSSEPALGIPKSEHRTILKLIYSHPSMAATDLSHFFSNTQQKRRI